MSAVEYKKEGTIGIVTLNRPENRNSMTPELLGCFSETIDKVIADDDLRVLLITGKGYCFSAGADFKSVVQLGDESKLDHERSYEMYRPFLKVLDVPVPVVAALNGHAVGGGFGLSLTCDIRIANRESKYGANFAKLGLHPGLGISYLLPRLIGLSRASEMLYSGELILGSEAEKIGLVSKAVEAELVWDQAWELCKKIADNAPVAVRLTKQSLQESRSQQVKDAAYREAYAQAATLKMADAQEGVAALLEKRKANFTGK